jgi:hypothetical protein
MRREVRRAGQHRTLRTSRPAPFITGLSCFNRPLAQPLIRGEGSELSSATSPCDKAVLLQLPRPQEHKCTTHCDYVFLFKVNSHESGTTSYLVRHTASSLLAACLQPSSAGLMPACLSFCSICFVKPGSWPTMPIRQASSSRAKPFDRFRSAFLIPPWEGRRADGGAGRHKRLLQ